MPHITAIELDGDTCTIARTAVRGREVAVSAAEILKPSSFPGADAFVAALRNARRSMRLARRCRVVLWGLPDGATPRDPGAASVLAPLTAAGFKVDRVVTPCNALGALSRVKGVRGDEAICWVAINTSGVAIAAIRPGQQIYSRSFGWDSTVGSRGSQAHLLQRYSLVAFLSPEVTRAMIAARAIGHPVRAVVTCGNLPDLRSLTMPLIEELDVEVETLDSLDGLIVSPTALDRLTEIAAAIRLACAGAIARRTRPWDLAERGAAHRAAVLRRAAAVVALLGGLVGAYLLYGWWRTPQPAPVSAPVSSPSPTAAAVPPVQRSTPPAAAPAATATRNPAPPPLRTAPPLAQPKPAPPQQSAPAAVSSEPLPPSPAPAPAAPPPLKEDWPSAGIDPRYGPAQGSPPARLKDRLPRVTAILIANERRFATIDDGRVVGVGDSIGRRVVVSIDERAVTLREPSGARVRLTLGGRQLSAR